MIALAEHGARPGSDLEALALAREVKAALEAGEIGLHANELEPFADRLR